MGLYFTLLFLLGFLFELTDLLFIVDNNIFKGDFVTKFSETLLLC